MNSNSPTLQFSPVSPAAPGPLYEQLVANVKREISAGRLAADEALPSTRQLAADLRVSVITIARAYDELEKLGIVYSRQGQRTFVAHDALEKLQQERSAPWNNLVAAVDVARKANMSDEELIRLLHVALTQRGKK